jgi:hypothetical protein
MMFATILNQPHTVFPSLAAAEAIAAANRDGDEDGWDYVAVADPAGSGRAIIRVYDETGEFVENL